MDKVNLNKSKKNSSLGIIIAIFFVFGLIGNLGENLGAWGDFLIVFLIFGIAIFSMIWKYKKSGLKEMMMKNGGGFWETIKKIAEQEKKRKINSESDLFKIVDVVGNLKNENSKNPDEKENENLRFDLNNQDEAIDKSSDISNIFKILPILFIFGILITIIFGKFIRDENKFNFGNMFLENQNSYVTWIIIGGLVLFIILFTVYNYYKKIDRK
ncbi:hypothetical protein K9M48_02220 [Candidatus Gracilibacteria bacterium]|nr:hypothetical protein [Candidatus Gracilibacteria bacterium]